MKERIRFLRQIITKKQEELSRAPEGTLNIHEDNGRPRYYVNNQGKRSYIKANNQELIQKLSQKEYDLKILRTAEKELRQLEKLNIFYADTLRGEICESVYDRMDAARKNWIHPICLPDNEFIRQWESVPYERKNFREDAPEYYTDKGERVRSKTEIIIANMLNKQNIPYRYEYPLHLKGYGIIHPDFTVLNVRERREMYFEHMGKMDDETYREDALKRILAYEKNGIFPGDRLVLTHETGKEPIDSRLLEKVICHYFL